MSESAHEETYLCLLDNLEITGDLHLGDFQLQFFSPQELLVLLRGREDASPSDIERAKIERYAMFPWAIWTTRPASGPPRNEFERTARRDPLSFNHAGRASWWPFQGLIRALHLMKPSPGPIRPVRFYYRPEAYTQTSAQIDAVGYDEPTTVDNEEVGEVPAFGEYKLGADDVPTFEQVDEKLRACLDDQIRARENPHLNIAIHFFERGDRKMTPHIRLDPFEVIETLLSYDACLESLLVRENEHRGTAETMASRLAAMMNDTSGHIRPFALRVFWLRSKIAHGVKAPSKVADWIVRHPDSAIPEAQGDARLAGPYNRLLLEPEDSPGFLANLRECARWAIVFFCDELVAGRSRDMTLTDLDS
jgi:hypothetical protein